jgi:hypothetical protein
MRISTDEALSLLQTLAGKPASIRPNLCFARRVNTVVTGVEYQGGEFVVTTPEEIYRFERKSIETIGEWWKGRAIVVTFKDVCAHYVAFVTHWYVDHEDQDWPIHSPHPAVFEDPRELDARTEMKREDYPRLPWTMREVVGSRWCNVYTGAETAVLELVESDHAEPLLKHRKGFGSDVLGLGLWYGDRCVVDNWVRIDHLPPTTRLGFFEMEIARLRDKLARAERSLSGLSPGDSCYAQNKNLHEQEIESLNDDVGDAIGRMTAYANRHNLSLGLERINAGIQPGQQMALL